MRQPLSKTGKKLMTMGDSGNAVTILQKHFRHMEGEPVGVEVGVHRAGLSTKLLAAFPRLLLYMVDPWTVYTPDDPYVKSIDGCAGFENDDQEDNLRVASESVGEFKHRANILRLTSEAASHLFADSVFSFAFIDANHTYEATAADIALWWPKIQPGGLLMGHDYNHPRNFKGKDGGNWGVNSAVDEFVAAKHPDAGEFGLMGSCWWVVKKA